MIRLHSRAQVLDEATYALMTGAPGQRAAGDYHHAALWGVRVVGLDGTDGGGCSGYGRKRPDASGYAVSFLDGSGHGHRHLHGYCGDDSGEVVE
jgi:hypothetical protein